MNSIYVNAIELNNRAATTLVETKNTVTATAYLTNALKIIQQALFFSSTNTAHAASQELSLNVCMIQSSIEYMETFGESEHDGLNRIHRRPIHIPNSWGELEGRESNMAISAAISTCLSVPPITSVNPPAAIAEETPISAWQPPTAPEIVAFFLKIPPISPEAKRNR